MKHANPFLVFGIGALLATSAFAATEANYSVKIKPNSINGTGSDDYGYTYIDSNDTTAAAPVYNWIDVSSLPNAVDIKGLFTDDNSIGPYQLGFDFSYYWYTVDKLWIKSNGGISWSSPLPFNHNFSEFKSTALPNDLVCGLCGDLDPGPGSPGSAWWWTNGADSAIVSFENIREFSSANPPPVTSHTFQMIISGADSSITFQYGPQTGDFTDQGSLANVIGIETVLGALSGVGNDLGIAYLKDNLPVENMYTDSLVVKFDPPPSTTFQIEDVGPGWVNNNFNQAFFMNVGDTLYPTLSLQNFGTVNSTTVEAKLRMFLMPSFSLLYNETEAIGNLDAQTSQQFSFPTPFVPSANDVGPFAMEYEVKTNPTDGNNLNDKLYSQYRVVDFTQPEVLVRYDGVEQNFTSRSWNGDSSGFANEFEFPADAYPIWINKAEFESGDLTAAGPAWIRVHLMDAGPNQDQPGTVIHEEVIQVTAGNTVYETVLPQPYQLDSGKFAVSVLHLVNSSFGIRIEQTNFAPCNRGWEYTGGFAPDRSRATDNLMIRATITSTLGVDVDENENVVESYNLAQNFPNPFNPTTQISFQIPETDFASLTVFNVLGQEVKTLVNEKIVGGVNHTAQWDGTDLNGNKVASGVYFYKLTSGDFSDIKKMVLLK